MKVYRNVEVDGAVQQKVIFEIGEATYSGTDMGERKITATIKYQEVIDFQVGDYVELDMADLLGGHDVERFYLYNLPTIKKNARKGSVGDAFEHTVTFYPAQFELGITQMRDILHQNSVEEITAENFVYTGYDEFSFYGGAHTLMRRILYVLQDRFGTEGTAGVDYWDYAIAEAVDEDINTALEKYQFDFSGNSVWDALCKLNSEDGVNTDFFIVGRMIYVGFKRPNIVGVDDNNILQETPFLFTYGKTSHLPISTNHGNLFSITKSIADTSPITRLYAYGDSRNLNRFYASDRLRSGRYVSKLMLPSFNCDGKTDWIDSVDGIRKFGVREATQNFEEIYPSLRYITYGDLRTIQYVIMLENGGGLGTSGNIKLTVPTARVQCYKVEFDDNGIAHLERSYPKDKLAVFIHATGKIIKCVLYPSEEKQADADYGNLPKEGTSASDAKVIVGSCYCVHDNGYKDYLEDNLTRKDWFANPEEITDTKAKHEIELHQIEYTDDYWITDVFLFDDSAPYDEQRVFSREPYSVYCYPHINKKYNNGSEASDNLPVNEIVAVEPVTIVDTDLNKENGKGQKTFVIYMRDFGFMIDEQAYSGQYQWLVNGEFKINFLDGYMAGLDFTVSAKGDGVIPAYKTDGSFNEDWFIGVDKTIAKNALEAGAFWRIICNRNTDNEYSYMPNTILNPQSGDHVVFLSIYMPDLYILAAERRLLAEAQKYLNEHDNGDITYSLELDKVRLAQVPAFGLQMREGAVMRIVDEDLQIYTENEETYLYSNSAGLLSEMDLSEQPYVERKLTPIKMGFRNFKQSDIFLADIDLLYTYKYRLTGIFVQNGKERLDAEILNIIENDSGNCRVAYKMPQLTFNHYGIFYVGYKVQNTDALVLSGILAFKQPFEFKANKHYTIEMDILSGELGADINEETLILTSGIDRLSSVYYPKPVMNKKEVKYDGTTTIVYEFDTSSAFNDKNPFYIALSFDKSGTQHIAARLLSIKESNTDESGEYAKFVDLTIDSLTIDISDGVNEYSVGGTTTNSSSSSSSSKGKNGSSKTIKATVKEKRMATAWQAMANEVKDNSIVSTQNTKTNEQLADIARRHYRELESLKDNIFDPDGTINDVFLQTMLLQVGANSMNYTLDKTKVFNGTYRNLHFEQVADDIWTIYFGEDKLRHYVYTEGSQLGTWDIKESETKTELEGDKVYYIALKCERNGSVGTWVVDTEQHTVDEEDGYWYFNYGIVSAASGTTRYLTETRGNVFVYGDNINAGKIVTMDGNSYLDLTGNAFKLGDQLLFQDGVLKIGGVNDSSSDSILTRLGLTETTATNAQAVATTAQTTATTAQTTATNAQSTANEAYDNASDALASIDNMQIGGENLYDLGSPLKITAGTSNWAFRVLLSNLEHGASYVFSCEKSEITTGAATQYTIKLYNFAKDKEYSTATLSIGNAAQSCLFTVPNDSENYSIIIYAGISGSTANNTVSWTNIMIQKGNRGTEYQQPAWSRKYYNNISIPYSSTDIIYIEGILYDIPAGKYKAYMRSEKKGDGATGETMSNSCLLWAAAGIREIASDAMTVYSGSYYVVSDWGEEVELKETCDLFVITANKEWVFEAIENAESPAEFSEDGTWTINEAVIDTYITDANAARINDLDYLKSALASTTIVAGGLLMTTVLMLRNEQNAVVAGMSGIQGTAANKENVLMWGGGTYKEALSAVQNLTKLPVLLTKTGGGSNIGCLKLMDDNKTIMVTGQSKGMNVVITSETAQYVMNNIYTGYYYGYQKYTFSNIASTSPQTKEILSLKLLSNQSLRLDIDNILLPTYRSGLDNYSTIDFYICLIDGSVTKKITMFARKAILYKYVASTGKYTKYCRADVAFETFLAAAVDGNTYSYIGVLGSNCTSLDGKTISSTTTYYVQYAPTIGSITSADSSALTENRVRGLSISNYSISNTNVSYVKLYATNVVAQGTATASMSFDKLALFAANGLCIISSDGITIQKGTGRFSVNASDQLDVILDGLPTANDTSTENHLYMSVNESTGDKTLMLSHA